MFSRRGYRETSVDEIAEEAETSKGGVYFHFPGKQMLFRALLDLSAKRLLDRVEEAIARETTPVARADAALLTVLRTFAEHRTLARLFMIEALGAGPEFSVTAAGDARRLHRRDQEPPGRGGGRGRRARRSTRSWPAGPGSAR